MGFESFIATSTISSSSSKECAINLPSPEESASEPVVTTRSGSILSEALGGSSSPLISDHVVNVATFSSILRLIASSLRACRHVNDMKTSSLG